MTLLVWEKDPAPSAWHEAAFPRKYPISLRFLSALGRVGLRGDPMPCCLWQKPTLQPPTPTLASPVVGGATAHTDHYLLCREIYLGEHLHSDPITSPPIPLCTGPNLWPLKDPSKHFTQKRYFHGK